MISINQALKEIISDSPFLEDGIYNWYINFSSFANYIRPRIEQITKKKVTISSIKMWLTKYSKETQKIIDNFPKEKIYKYKKPKKKPYLIVKPDAADLVDTTTYPLGQGPRQGPVKPMMCGGEARGTGAAIKGKGFKGVF